MHKKLSNGARLAHDFTEELLKTAITDLVLDKNSALPHRPDAFGTIKPFKYSNSPSWLQVSYNQHNGVYTVFFASDLAETVRDKTIYPLRHCLDRARRLADPSWDVQSFSDYFVSFSRISGERDIAETARSLTEIHSALSPVMVRIKPGEIYNPVNPS